MKKSTKVALFGFGTLGVGLFGWVQLRLYARREVLRVLNAPGPEGYEYDKKMQSGIFGKFGSTLLNIPPARALAESTVPLWETTHPYDAFDDILANGRRSKYWPKGYNSLLPKAADEHIFATLRAMSETMKEIEEQKQLKG
jgi:hypothetical protein